MSQTYAELGGQLADPDTPTQHHWRCNGAGETHDGTPLACPRCRGHLAVTASGGVRLRQDRARGRRAR